MYFPPIHLLISYQSCDCAMEDGKCQLKSGRKNWAGGRKKSENKKRMFNEVVSAITMRSQSFNFP